MNDREDIIGFRDGSPIRRHPESTSELPGERSARIVQEIRAQEEQDEAAAQAALERFRLYGTYPEAEESAFKIGYKHALRDARSKA